MFFRIFCQLAIGVTMIASAFTGDVTPQLIILGMGFAALIDKANA